MLSPGKILTKQNEAEFIRRRKASLPVTSTKVRITGAKTHHWKGPRQGVAHLVSRCPSFSVALVQPEGPFPSPAAPSRDTEDAREEGAADEASGPQGGQAPARGGTARGMQAVKWVYSSGRPWDSKPRGGGERRPSPWGDSTPGASGGPREQWPVKSQGQSQTPIVLRPPWPAGPQGPLVSQPGFQGPKKQKGQRAETDSSRTGQTPRRGAMPGDGRPSSCLLQEASPNEPMVGHLL